MADMVEKWGQAVAERGFAQIPNYLLLLNNFLDEDSRLTPVELLVLFQLVGAWWQKENMPFPSMATLANRLGVSERQVQRAVARLVKDNVIAKTKRRTQGIIASNAYDMSPLVDLLKEVAKAFPNEFPRTVKRRRTEVPADLKTLAASSFDDVPPKQRRQIDLDPIREVTLDDDVFSKPRRRKIQLDDVEAGDEPPAPRKRGKAMF